MLDPVRPRTTPTTDEQMQRAAHQSSRTPAPRCWLPRSATMRRASGDLVAPSGRRRRIDLNVASLRLQTSSAAVSDYTHPTALTDNTADRKTCVYVNKLS